MLIYGKLHVWVVWICASYMCVCVCVHACVCVRVCIYCTYAYTVSTQTKSTTVCACVCTKVTIIRYWDHQDASIYMYVCVAVYTCFIISQTGDAATLTSKPMALGIMFINYVCAGV